MKEDIAIVEVAKETIKVLDYVDPLKFDNTGDRSYGHLLAILTSVQQGKVVGTKAHRFVGWAQCAISDYMNTNSQLFRDINRKHLLGIEE